ncbi:hypothetical protein GCM10011414_21240 [Croceivirga lutea]|uniref:PKD domain-containing protein n=1 Tax=Croceivirga lutea TaxID=1775167 RepID=UPI00163A7EED|nr:PKD domain-containing protein [Croceivirga lutea]GGG51436.1 hypothetical protein GCM10011414_21240 [Croceivirga lutea]
MNLTLKKGKILSLAILLLAFIGCGDDDEEMLPEVVAGFSQEIDQATGTVTFINTSENASSYSWDFGNGNTSTSQNPTQVYENGDYTVTMTASNVAGDSDTASASISINIPEEEEEFDSGLLTNGDFEAGVEPWIGNAANVQEDGGNSFNFANVEAAGNVFDVNLSQVVEITQGTNYILKFDASSDRERTILAGLGLNEAPFTNTAVEINLTEQTQTFELQLAATDFGGANSRVLFDMGGAVGTVVIDNVSLVEGGDGSDSSTDDGGTDFDSGLLTNGDFEAGVEPWIGNAANVQEDGGNSFNFANIEAAGNVFDVNLSQVVEITQGTNYILKFDASSDRERTMLAGIGLNEAPFTNSSVEINLNTETQTYELQLAAADFGGANSRVLFDMGGAVGVVVIDNVSLVEGGDGSDSGAGDGGTDFDSGLLTNGDFEAGVTPWIGNAANVQEDGGNSFNFANVEAAGNVFDVNLSQVVAITQGTNYILKFDASSDRERTILAGIGLNEAPFTNTAVEISLNTESQTYELQLAAADFGGANSRVLFDMGGAIGTVVIDNVSLVEGGDGSDSNTGGDGSTPGDGSGFTVDFESGGSLSGAFDNGANGATTTNPDQSGLNTSATVYQFNKTVGSAWYSGVFNIFSEDISATGGTTFKVKMWSPNPNINVRFQLEKEGNQGPIVTYNVDQTLVEANTWVELTFDLSTTAIDLADGYDKFVIFPDYDESNQVDVATEAIYYIDDIIQE